MRFGRCVLLAVGAWIGLGSSAAVGQEDLAAGLVDGPTGARSATDFFSRVRARVGYLDVRGETRLVSTRISGTWAPIPSLALRLQLPLPWVDPPTGESRFGTGELSLRALGRVYEHPRIAIFVGGEIFFPTASDPILGTEKYSLSPIAAAIVPILDNFFFIPIYQQLISVAGNDDRADINIVRFRPAFLLRLPRGWYGLLDPGFLWDIEDDLLTEDTMTIGLEIGKQVTDAITVSAKPSVQTYGTEDFSWAAEVSLTYRFD